MYYVYLIQSKKTRELYIGVTYDLARRFKEHNEGKSFSTKSARPWILIYYEAYKAVKDAYEREKQIKHYGQSLGHLKRRLKFSLN
ncbi:MAG: GIY-YIG nuclease family protein [Patescibacteria group bacterium]